MRILSLPAPTPEVDAVARYMGMPAANANDDILRAIAEAMQALEPVVSPIAVWALAKIHAVERESIALIVEEKKVAVQCNGAFFKGAQQVLCSLLTLGEACDVVAGELYDRDLLLGMAFDAAASATISLVSQRYLSWQRQEMHERHLQMGLAFAPGCQGLPLTAQESIFEILQPEPIGVKLSEVMRITPTKSVTSVAPVGPKLPQWMLSISPCQLCSLRKTCRLKETKSCDPGHDGGCDLGLDQSEGIN